ncbi:hypothetical protein D3C85_1726920 [compost metagenome]
MPGLDRNPQGIATLPQLAAILQVVLHIRVIRRDHFFEGGIELQTQRLVAEHQAEQDKDAQNDAAVIEQKPFNQGAGRRIEHIRLRDGLMLGRTSITIH